MDKLFITIMGIPASGLSVIGQSLKILGLNQADAGASSIRANTINRLLLQDLGLSEIMVGPLPPNWIESSEADRARIRINSLIASCSYYKAPSFLNDALMYHFMPLWSEEFHKHNVSNKSIIMVRHPWEVSQSLFRKHDIEISDTLLLWLKFASWAFQHSRMPGHALVTFDQLLADPVSTLINIEEQLKLKWPKSSISEASNLLAYISPTIKGSHNKNLSKEFKQKHNILDAVYQKLRVIQLTDIKNDHKRKMFSAGNAEKFATDREARHDLKITSDYGAEIIDYLLSISDKYGGARIKQRNKASVTINTKESRDGHAHLIFLISLPRSGSTLLQLVLSMHSDIHTTAEPWLMLHPLHALKTNNIKAKYNQSHAVKATLDFLSTVPENLELYYQAVRAYGLTFYNRALREAGKLRFLDKTPRYYTIIPELFRTFPNARYIILLRNPMAILSSVLKTWFSNDPHKFQHSLNLRDMMDGPQAILEGIECLNDKATIIHYEDLVSSPEEYIENICGDLGIRCQNKMLEYSKNIPLKGQFGDQVGVYKHERPVTDYIYKWIDNLSKPKLHPYAIEYMHKLGIDTFTKLGYEYSLVESALMSSNPTLDNLSKLSLRFNNFRKQ